MQCYGLMRVLRYQERMVGRAGLIRPLASPFGPAQALSKIDGAILSNLNAASHPQDSCAMQCYGLMRLLRYQKRMVGRAGFEPATN